MTMVFMINKQLPTAGPIPGISQSTVGHVTTTPLSPVTNSFITELNYTIKGYSRRCEIQITQQMFGSVITDDAQPAHASQKSTDLVNKI